jgi:DNA-binding MarR family transcriptional regulator
LNISKQSASQLIDTLVLRDYLTRNEDPDDRRRLVITPTKQGKAAAAAIAKGVQRVDERLSDHCSSRQIQTMRTGLFALIKIHEEMQASE